MREKNYQEDYESGENKLRFLQRKVKWTEKKLLKSEEEETYNFKKQIIYDVDINSGIQHSAVNS